MTRRVLALIDARSNAAELAPQAARVAAAENAHLLIGIDVDAFPFAALSERLATSVRAAQDAGARTSTVLVDSSDPVAIARIARNNAVDLLVIEDRTGSEAALDDIVMVLGLAGIAILRVQASRAYVTA